MFVKLDENQALRDRAFSALQGLKRDKSSAGTLLAAAQSRYDREHVDHTLKYTSELETKLQQADSRFSSASDYLAAATANLPDVNINDHLGDPLLALDNIEQAVVEITEQNTLTAYVTSRLDYLAEAKANAASRTAQAEIEIEVSDSHLWNLVVTRDYDPDRALQQAYGLLDSAVFSYDKAVEKLENPVFGDGKIDYPVAYEAAKASIASSNAAIASANQVVAADDASLAKLAQYDSRRASAQSAISNAQSAENTLRSNHASSAWSGVSSNISNAQSKLSTAASLRQDAINARTSQDFLLADSKAQQALNELGNIESLCNSVVSRKSTLENVRLHDWPNAKSDAESAIRSARSQISASHTDASVYSANSLIEDAESAARQERYEDAVRLARDAESEADSERREAISDEQAYQRQLEADAQATRDKAEANAQATRQKENANAQATRDAESINSSPPIDSGSGSDSGSSGSNNSSGGSSNSGGSSGDSGSIGGSNGDNCAFGCP